MLSGALGLAGELGETGSDLGDDEGDLLEVLAGSGKAVLGVVNPGSEAFDVGGLIEESAAFVGVHGEDLIDEALTHDGVTVLADITFHEKVYDVAQADAGAIEEVFGVAVAVDAAGDFDFSEVDGEPAFLVVECEDDLGHTDGGTATGSGEDDVFLFLCAKEAG